MWPPPGVRRRGSRPDNRTQKARRLGGRGSFGGSFGLLFAMVVVVSAISVSVTTPSESNDHTRPHAAIDAVTTGVNSTLAHTNEAVANRSSGRGDDGEVPVDDAIRPSAVDRSSDRAIPDRMRSVIPDRAWAKLPIRTQELLQTRITAFVSQVRAQQSRDGALTRITPAGDGIERGMALKQHPTDEHSVDGERSETYTEEKTVLDRYESVLDRYDETWAASRPGADWEHTGDSKQVVVDRDFQWATTKPGSEWEDTGTTRDIVLDRDYRWAFTKPGDDWRTTGRRTLRYQYTDPVWAFQRPGIRYRKIPGATRPVVDRDFRWSETTPGPGWEQTGAKRTVIDRHYRWATRRPGPGWRPTGRWRWIPTGREYEWAWTRPGWRWHPTGRTRPKKVDTDYQRSIERPGPEWERVRQIDTQVVQVGVENEYDWTFLKAFDIQRLLGDWKHQGIVDTRRVQTDERHRYVWSDSLDPLADYTRDGYALEAITDKKPVQTGTETTWRWWYQGADSRVWTKVGQKQVLRGYRTKVRPERPVGAGWERVGLDHVEKKKHVSTKEKIVVGWYTAYDRVQHIHYNLADKWVPGHWVGHDHDRVWHGYHTRTKRIWHGWHTKRTKVWHGYHRKCTRQWDWGTFRSYRTCRDVWHGYHTRTKRIWHGYHTRTHKVYHGYHGHDHDRRWVPGHYETVKKPRVHYHKVPKRTWGPHKETVEVVDWEEVKHYKWRQPVYQLKFKYQRPVYEWRYKHHYVKPIYRTEYRHRYTKPKYEERPVYQWKKDVYRTQRLYEKPSYVMLAQWVHETEDTEYRWVNERTRTKYKWGKPELRWQYQWVNTETETQHKWVNEETESRYKWRKPVYRDEPVYKTITVTKERLVPVTRSVTTAPFTHDGDGNWTLATTIEKDRDSRMRIDRTFLTSNRSEARVLEATSAVTGDRWTLAAWRDDDAIVIRTSTGVEHRVDAPFATIDFDAGTINGEDVDIALAKGIETPYTLAVERGGSARGTYEFVLVGIPTIDGQPLNLAADDARVTVADGVVYSATFDVTYETDATTYTDRITLEPPVSFGRDPSVPIDDRNDD